MRPALSIVRTSCLALLALAWVGPAHAAASEGDARCWADWSAAAPVVQRESLRPAKDVRAIAQQHNAGQLLNITLCEDKGKFVYRLLILRAAGTVDSMSVDAHTPFGK